MEFADVKNFLDWHVINLSKRTCMRHLDSNIRIVSPDRYFQFNEGIEIVADIMGLHLIEDDKKNGDYFVYYFVYEGVKFMQLSEERLGMYARID